MVQKWTPNGPGFEGNALFLVLCETMESRYTFDEPKMELKCLKVQ